MENAYSILSDMLKSQGIDSLADRAEMAKLLKAKKEMDGTISLLFPTDPIEQQRLAELWSKFTHLSEEKTLEIIKALIVVLQSK